MTARSRFAVRATVIVEARRLGRLVVAAAAVAAAAVTGGCRTSPRIDGPPPRVELRLAEFDPAEGFIQVRTRQGETIHVAPEPVIDLEDIASASLAKHGYDERLLLDVKTGSRMRLEGATAGHLRKPVALLLDEEVVYVPLLVTSISRQVPVRIGANGITVEEARRVADAVADQRQFGPWSIRSGDPLHSRAGRVRSSGEASEAAVTAPATAAPPPSPAPGP